MASVPTYGSREQRPPPLFLPEILQPGKSQKKRATMLFIRYRVQDAILFGVNDPIYDLNVQKRRLNSYPISKSNNTESEVLKVGKYHKTLYWHFMSLTKAYLNQNIQQKINGLVNQSNVYTKNVKTNITDNLGKAIILFTIDQGIKKGFSFQ
ncbi:hypothetical protein [Photobacterium leiognathi]|nr:hypothetical protein [Photobacterium leiognathi]